MPDLKMKAAASIIIFAVIASTLSVFATSTANGCTNQRTYLFCDLNQDGIIDIKDVSILALAWQSRVGCANFNARCDFNGDGIVDIKDASLLAVHWTWFLKAHVLIFPHTLNLKSHGNWVTCVILLSAKKINASDIDVSSIRLNGTIAVDSEAPVCSFHSCLVVKFSREAVIALIRESLNSTISVDCGKFTHVTLAVSGTLSNGVKFSGSDIIRVVQCHKCGH
jgi:hypothetical protein